MTAYPWIVSATGFASQSYPGEVQLLALFENKAIEGHTIGNVRFYSYKLEGGTCWYVEKWSDIASIDVTRWNLKNRMLMLPAGFGLYNFGCISSDYCKDPGVPDICSSGWVRVSYLSDIPIRAYSSTQPALPNVTVTPMNGALNIKWDPVTNVDVFSYYISVLDGTTSVEEGDVENTLRDITIGNLTNGKTYTIRVRAVSHSNVVGQVAQKTAIPVGNTDPFVYNTYTTPDVPVAGSPFTITAEIANKGPNGKVRAVFKVDGVQISDQNSTLVTFQDPGRVLWSPTATYTMPNKTITITVDGYGWDGSKWVPTHTMSITRIPSVPTCSGITLTPFAASIKAGEKVIFTATATPATQALPVKFRDTAGTVLATCTTSGGSCTFIWDSAGKVAGNYFVQAVVEGQCTSTTAIIQVSAPIQQWNLSLYALDSTTGKPVQGATAVVGTQTKQTDINGLALFRADQGTVSVSISATGYNAVTTVESLYTDRTINYPLTSTTPTTGSIMFVSVPSNAGIFLDGKDQNARTPVQIFNIPAGKHTFTLKLAGFNDTTGDDIMVTGGGTVQAYAILTPLSPTAGSLSLFSTPPGAGIFIDDTDQKATTPKALTGLTGGPHNVKLTLSGYLDWTGTVTVYPGQTAYLNPALTLLATIGALEISSVPAGARVFIDGADTQKITPATITNLVAGEHTYRLTLPGYSDATGTFLIEMGKTTPVLGTLNKSIGAALLVAAAIGVGIAVLATTTGGK